MAWEVCLPLLYYSIIKFGQTRRQPANVQTRTMVWESDSACSTNVLGIRVLVGGRGLSFGHGNTTEKRALWEGNGRQSSGDCILQDTPEAWKRCGRILVYSDAGEGYHEAGDLGRRPRKWASLSRHHDR